MKGCKLCMWACSPQHTLVCLTKLTKSFGTLKLRAHHVFKCRVLNWVYATKIILKKNSWHIWAWLTKTRDVEFLSLSLTDSSSTEQVSQLELVSSKLSLVSHLESNSSSTQGCMVTIRKESILNTGCMVTIRTANVGSNATSINGIAKQSKCTL